MRQSPHDLRVFPRSVLAGWWLGIHLPRTSLTFSFSIVRISTSFACSNTTLQYNGQYTTTALCTVNFPGWAAGHQCKLHFSTGPDGYVQTAEGFSRRGQIFTLGSSDISAATWNGRGPAYRDQQIGTFVNLERGTEAGWEGSNTFPCPSTLKGFEIVPTGDNMYASWGTPHGLTVEIL